ncbi:rhodanese domain protein [Elysia marginata]|uniref:Rhodanese domain protein n=1 Tax=Elysia marginata TaxID=1093978 RepID=A0AAV4JDX1_9GAST|nr:rhodanese domain protein [Elysia marginata]
MANTSSADPDDHEKSKPGFFMKSTIASLKLKFPSVKNISTAQLWSWLQHPQERSVYLLDARPVEEYNVSHLENSHRIDYEDVDLDALVKTLEENFQGKKNPTVVCYCSLGYRSSLVAKNLQQFYEASGKNPTPEIYNLSGSLFQWANEERPMVDSNGQKTHLAHPYTPFWGKLLDEKHRMK